MTETLLVASVGATLFMVGLTWFVQAVHYPLFIRIGRDSFAAYHEAHSIRTTWVVALPMVLELVSSVGLAFDPPAGEEVLAVIGAILAVSVWAVTLAWAAPTHSAIGRNGLTQTLSSRLLRASLVRTWLWTLHGVVVLLLVARLVEVA